VTPSALRRLINHRVIIVAIISLSIGTRQYYCNGENVACLRTAAQAVHDNSRPASSRVSSQVLRRRFKSIY